MTGSIPSACDDCLRRAWLVEGLAPLIEAGRGTGGLLGLDDRRLAGEVAGNGAARILDRLPDPLACRALLEATGTWAVCRCDDRFPPGLEDASDAPRILFGLGDPSLLELLVPELTVTIVGARRATGYGLGVAAELGREVAAAGALVVSGMALGVDAAAHAGALAADSTTVAVLGGGPDRPTPRRNRALWEQIAARGLVLAERPPGARPYRWSFPARNRIMAALAGITVVVEARERSGSLITAEMAADLGRDVGAVPGPVTSPASGGTNRLLADGAFCCRGAADVCGRLGIEGRGDAGGPPVTDEQRRVLSALEAGASTLDAVARASGVGAARAGAVVARLELAGYVLAGLDGRPIRTSLRTPGEGI